MGRFPVRAVLLVFLCLLAVLQLGVYQCTSTSNVASPQPIRCLWHFGDLPGESIRSGSWFLGRKIVARQLDSLREAECNNITKLLDQQVEFFLRYETQQGVCFAVIGRECAVLSYSFRSSWSVARLGLVMHRPVTLVLPLFERAAAFKRFLHDYSEIRKHDNNVFLIVVECLSTESPLIARIAADSLMALHFLRPQCGQHFSRGAMLQIGLSKVFSGDLFLAVDVDFKFTSGLLHRVRSLTRQGVSVTLPVCFSLYPSVNVSLSPGGRTFKWHGATGYNEGSGYWREAGYGMVAAYKMDIESVGGYSRSEGWGGEDVRLAQALSSRFEVFRYLEPDFLHLWHAKNCSGPGNQKACVEVEAQNRGSQLQLAMRLDKLVSNTTPL